MFTAKTLKPATTTTVPRGHRKRSQGWPQCDEDPHLFFYGRCKPNSIAIEKMFAGLDVSIFGLDPQKRSSLTQAIKAGGGQVHYVPTAKVPSRFFYFIF